MSDNHAAPGSNPSRPKRVKTSSVESPDNPDYLKISYTKQLAKQPSPPRNPMKTYKPEIHVGVSADAPSDFQVRGSVIVYNKTKYDPFQDFGVKNPQEPPHEYTKQEKPAYLSLLNTYHIRHASAPPVKQQDKDVFKKTYVNFK